MIFEIGLRIVAVLLIGVGVLDHRDSLAVGGCVLVGASVIAGALARRPRE